MTKTKEFRLPSRVESVERAALELAEFARELDLSEEFTYAVEVAVREAVTNAVKHGNKLDESRDVEVRLANDDEAFSVSVEDSGTGFSPDELDDPTDPENLLKASGRGILFMRSFMDEVSWTKSDAGGMVVKMSKRHL